MHAQPGIFALGAPEHCYLELDLATGVSGADLAGALAALVGPETTIAGVNLVVGVRPELWADAVPGAAPPGGASFEEVRGADLVMPATQHDAWVWVAGGSRSAVFDAGRRVIAAVGPVATVAAEVTGWLYDHQRDLTGFVDGTENPSLLEAGAVAIRAEAPGAGAGVVLVQQWRHLPSWGALAVAEQERVIGRTKHDSVELDEAVMPADAHVARNVIEEHGGELEIFRRNTAYGGPTDHGTYFVGFCAGRHPLQRMLESMAGVPDGVRDALTRYTEPLSGAYYTVPSVEALAALLPDEVEEGAGDAAGAAAARAPAARGAGTPGR
ncbi:MAG TPA: Dyp-type peroxidase [Acidimicrobiales bacterium]|nr:Dyp-type peroxidase [Acidimicrobiales bacterium]